MDELEVERASCTSSRSEGRRGDPDRRLRTVEERVTLELGPFLVTGNLHRPPNTQPMAALSRWARFVPLTDAVVGLRDRDDDGVTQEVVLVNRGRITNARPHAAVPIYTDGLPAPASRPA